jgi:hypothetical protein
MTGRFEIDGTSRRYGDVVALQEMTLEIRAGELFGFWAERRRQNHHDADRARRAGGRPR